MNIILIALYSLIDVLIFPFIERIPVIGWVLKYKGRDIYPVFRTLQFLMFAGSCYYLYPDYVSLTAYLLGFALMTTDLLYYAYRWEWQTLLILDEMKTDTFWLRHFWQSGQFLFKDGFRFKWFMVSGLTGLAILIVSNLI